MRTTAAAARSVLCLLTLIAAVPLAAGCGGSAAEKDRTFSTSGSREADQRAEQYMAREQQLKGGADEGDKKKAADGAVKVPEKTTLYDRLGGEEGIKKIVDDVVTRWLSDPQVNFERKGVEKGGFSLTRERSVAWEATPGVVAEIKKNLAQFLALKTGGPTRYDGPDFKSVAENKHVTNAEYDAARGDLKATLDKLQVADQEQKEVLQLMESARPQIVEER